MLVNSLVTVSFEAAGQGIAGGGEQLTGAGSRAHVSHIMKLPSVALAFVASFTIALLIVVFTMPLASISG